ncbi:MAG: pyocin activator PrtN family protein [Acidithiobacillus sp.]|nr:pyocin activator PrtN family protein [Acidithiobacillus sp.]
MNTVFLLMAEYGQADIPLEVLASKYLGMSRKESAMRAVRGELPFPAFRLGSQKSPWMVRVTDLAEYLDSARKKSIEDWEVRQSVQHSAGFSQDYRYKGDV